MTNRRALITGVSGQDGYYLSRLLLEDGYSVAGLVSDNDVHAGTVTPEVEMITGDLRDADSLSSAVNGFQPTEVYNLAAQSSVGESFKAPVQTMDVNGLGTVRLLEACRNAGYPIRFFQSSTAELFGDVSGPQDESSPINPTSPYAISKAVAHFAVDSYRRTYSMFACAAILYNHESPHRGINFVTRKITDAVARIKLGTADSVTLGTLDVWRDWGYAGDYVQAIHTMLQQPAPKDYVIASGESHSLQDFLELAFRHVGLDWHDYVKTDPALVRPAEITKTWGNPVRARRELGWQPSVSFEALVAMMVDNDLAIQTTTPSTPDETPVS